MAIKVRILLLYVVVSFCVMYILFLATLNGYVKYFETTKVAVMHIIGHGSYPFEVHDENMVLVPFPTDPSTFDVRLSMYMTYLLSSYYERPDHQYVGLTKIVELGAKNGVMFINDNRTTAYCIFRGSVSNEEWKLNLQFIQSYDFVSNLLPATFPEDIVPSVKAKDGVPSVKVKDGAPSVKANDGVPSVKAKDGVPSVKAKDGVPSVKDAVLQDAVLQDAVLQDAVLQDGVLQDGVLQDGVLQDSVPSVKDTVLQDDVPSVSINDSVPIRYYATRVGGIHTGFMKTYDTFRETLVTALMAWPECRQIVCLGYSLGAAMTTLLVTDPWIKHRFQTVGIAIASPRVGNIDFVNNNKSSPIFRIINQADIINDMPLAIMPNYKRPDKPYLYQHIGHPIEFHKNHGEYVSNHALSTYMEGLRTLLNSEE